MAKKPAAKSLPVRNRAAGRLERIADARWRHVERVVETIRSLGDAPLPLATAERMAKRLGVSWRTVYRYRDRLQSVDEATAVLGRTRGWKPPATRLSTKCRFPFNLSLLIFQLALLILSICHQAAGLVDVTLARHRFLPPLGF